MLFGQYSSIFILDSNSLETICTLRSGCKPNWNAAISFLLNPDKKGGEDEGGREEGSEGEEFVVPCQPSSLTAATSYMSPDTVDSP